MAYELCRVTIIMAVIATITRAIDVNVTGEWRPERGWEVTCSWETLANDTLQSVRLYNNGQQFMIYRPEKHGRGRTDVFHSSDKVMIVNCTIITYRGQEGRCVLLLEPYQPPVGNYNYTCEVSGERPMFRMGKKDYVIRVLVPPSDATILSKKEESSQIRVMMNCSSTGLPAPNLSWTVGNDKVQADFSGRVWSPTSKLWHVWSYLSYTKNDDSKVLCSPEVTSENEIIRGKPAEYNSASGLIGTATLVAIILVLSLLS
ncbi:uncharacterized protein LOC120631440 isoform X2 [Pararge aegeria]|uniref:uncharacterized protein LOC120631440 isoform X2 n=1 Tax=Pararge aegeria TaxID=116150 RepID=UPI0019D24115|nr:uncharacterized protein LOC120631440 isoform X2 [Pararge aegeria]